MGRKDKIKKEIDFSMLPRNKNTGIDWKKSIGYKINFIYDDISGGFYIIDYNINNRNLIIKYNNKEFKISTSSIILCNLGRILNKKTSEFKLNIGEHLNIKNQDLIIIDRKYKKDNQGANRKVYKYKCNKCGFECGEHWNKGVKQTDYYIDERDLGRGIGCACCSNKIVIQGINDILTTAPWMIPYIGLDIAKTHTHSSGDKIFARCPECGQTRKKLICISTIYITHSIGCVCNDGISYSEKIIYNLLNELTINFKTQLSCTDFKWCDKYYYDFYFKHNDEKYIIEANGEQHYEENTKFKKSLKEEIENDKSKKELAINNGIKEENYITIDCRYSELEFIKNNILNSKLSDIFDLSNIDWDKIEKQSCKSLIKEVCEIKNQNYNLTTSDISCIVKYSRCSVRNWLKIGKKLNLVNYDSVYESEVSRIKGAEKVSRKIIVLKNNELINIYKSVTSMCELIKIEYNINLLYSYVFKFIDKDKKYKGLNFKSLEDLTEEEYIKYDIENKLKELQEVS